MRIHPLSPRCRLAWSVGSGVALTAALFVAPSRIAGADDSEGHHLSRLTGPAVADYVHSGQASLTPPLAELTAYWSRFHAAKAALAAVLLVAAIALTVALCRRLVDPHRSRGSRITIVAAGAASTLLAVFALGVLMANIQGAAAPLSSLLTFLPADSASSGTSAQLADQLGGRVVSPPVRQMVIDFARYHRVMAITSAIVACICMVAGFSLAFGGFGRGTGVRNRRTRVMARWAAALVALIGVLCVVLCIANTTVALHPEPALLSFFRGGF